MAAAQPSVDGQDKVIAAAQQIVKSLAASQTAADDMLRIFAGFDNRLSAINGLFASHEPDGDAEADDPPSEEQLLLAAAESDVLRWDASDALLFEASSDERDKYLSSVDALIRLADGGDAALRARAEDLLQTSMARLEDELRHLMIRHTAPIDAALLSCPAAAVREPAHLDSIPLGPSSSRDSFASGSNSSHASLSFASEAGEDIDSSADDDFVGPTEAEEEEEEEEERMVDLIHPEAVPDLQAIAARMSAAGYGREVLHAYSDLRRDVLDECLSVLGVERVSIEEVQRIEWGTLSDRMRRWISAVHVVVRVLLAGERRLCDQVVGVFDKALASECFVESAKGCMLQVLNFGDAIAVRRRSPEKLFRILGMYEVLADVMPELKALFPRKSGEFMLIEAEEILKRLRDAARGTFNEFENAVQRETSKKPMHGGDVHPLTRYVMNYLKVLVCYRDLLNTLLDEDGAHSGDGLESAETDDSQNLENMTKLGRRLLLLITNLESNIEEKSKYYEDGALQYIFKMNNLLYIVQKVKDSELRSILGDQWVRRRRGQIRQHATSYLRISWTKLLSCLKDDGLGGAGSSHSVSQMALKERFKSFNLTFEEIYRTQTAWKVPDPQLREELRISISETVIPAYRSFMGRFGGQLEGGRHAARYIKYTSEDLENHLLDFFEGLSGLPGFPRRKLSLS